MKPFALLCATAMIAATAFAAPANAMHSGARHTRHHRVVTVKHEKAYVPSWLECFQRPADTKIPGCRW